MAALYGWVGGKHNSRKFIIPRIPKHKTYVECYFGAGHIFWSKEKSEIEVVNDFNSTIVNFLRVIQDPEKCKLLALRLAYTLYSYSTFVEALDAPTDSLDSAWSFFVKQNQGYGGLAGSPGNWGRNFGVTCATGSFTSKNLKIFNARIRDTIIHNSDALELLDKYDSEDTFFYLDPPYVLSTRYGGDYECECSDLHHAKLSVALSKIKGKVMLSGYDNKYYKDLENIGWRKLSYDTFCFASGNKRMSETGGAKFSGDKKRTENVWINYETGEPNE